MTKFHEMYKAIPDREQVARELVSHALPHAEQPTIDEDDPLLRFICSEEFWQADSATALAYVFVKHLGVADLLANPSQPPAGSNAYTYYLLDAEHYRFESKWVGHPHSVRVTLPERPRDGQQGVEIIPIPGFGDVRMADHSADVPGYDRSTHRAWYKEDLADGYRFRYHKEPPAFERVDLITGVRRKLMGIDWMPYWRFSPLSVFLALDGNGKPVFYALESGGFNGQSGRVHYAVDMQSEILDPIGFVPTLFTNQQWYYRGNCKLDANLEPQSVEVFVADHPNNPTHFRARLHFNVLGQKQPSPWEQFEHGAEVNKLMAILRQCVIAQGVGYRVPQSMNFPQLVRDLMNAIATMVREYNLLEWKEIPPNLPGIDRIGAKNYFDEPEESCANR